MSDSENAISETILNIAYKKVGAGTDFDTFIEAVEKEMEVEKLNDDQVEWIFNNFDPEF